MASRSTDGASYDSIEVGPTLNFFVKRFVRPMLTTPNEAKKNLLVFGVGYRYLAGINQAPENRIEIDFTRNSACPSGSRRGIAAESTYDLLRATTSPGGIEIA
jgi:hypothetical protein